MQHLGASVADRRLRMAKRTNRIDRHRLAYVRKRVVGWLNMSEKTDGNRGNGRSNGTKEMIIMEWK